MEKLSKGDAVQVPMDGYRKMTGKVERKLSGKWAGWYKVNLGDFSAKFHETQVERKGA